MKFVIIITVLPFSSCFIYSPFKLVLRPRRTHPAVKPPGPRDLAAYSYQGRARSNHNQRRMERRLRSSRIKDFVKDSSHGSSHKRKKMRFPRLIFEKHGRKKVERRLSSGGSQTNELEPGGSTNSKLHMDFSDCKCKFGLNDAVVHFKPIAESPQAGSSKKEENYLIQYEGQTVPHLSHFEVVQSHANAGYKDNQSVSFLNSSSKPKSESSVTPSDVTGSGDISTVTNNDQNEVITIPGDSTFENLDFSVLSTAQQVEEGEEDHNTAHHISFSGLDNQSNINIKEEHLEGSGEVIQAPSADVPDQVNPDKYRNRDSHLLAKVLSQHLWYGDIKSLLQQKGQKKKSDP